MSDSSIGLKPVIEEPSKPIPPSNASSSSEALIENDFSWPRTSVNQSRMKRTSRSRTTAITSSAVCGRSISRCHRREAYPRGRLGAYPHVQIGRPYVSDRQPEIFTGLLITGRPEIMYACLRQVSN